MITELELSTTCYCENEDGTPSECWGCYEDDREFIGERLESLFNATDTSALIVEGKGMGWTRANGHTAISAEPSAVFDLLSLNGDSRLVFKLDTTAELFEVMRYSHDEPVGAMFTFYFANRCDNCAVIPCECEEEEED